MKSFDWFLIAVVVWCWGTNLIAVILLSRSRRVGETLDKRFSRDALIGLVCLGIVIWRHS